MKLGQLVLTRQSKIDKIVHAAEKKQIILSKKSLADKVDKLEDTNSAQLTKIKSIERKNKELTAEVKALREDRDDVREIMNAKMEVEDARAFFDKREELLDNREVALDEREKRIDDKEEGRYKAGYADGVADGVRKINEITAQDRENAMKVAMVAAASHSTPEVIRELNDGAKSLTEGTSNSKTK